MRHTLLPKLSIAAMLLATTTQAQAARLCTSDAVCGTKQYCNLDVSPAQCTPKPTGLRGDPCSANLDCDPSMVCRVETGTCGAPSEAGQYCVTSDECSAPNVCNPKSSKCIVPACLDEGMCPAGFMCHVTDFYCGIPMAGWCGTEVQLLEPCLQDFECVDGTICLLTSTWSDYNDPSTGHCAVPQGMGWSCEVDDDCDGDTICNHGYFGGSDSMYLYAGQDPWPEKVLYGQCRPHSGRGQKCAETSDCTSGLTCSGANNAKVCVVQ